MSVHRTAAAAWNDMPTPVNSSTYAATHAGHLGINANVTIGAAHWIITAIRPRRSTGVFNAKLPVEQQQGMERSLRTGAVSVGAGP
jgi:hypothetical protein